MVILYDLYVLFINILYIYYLLRNIITILNLNIKGGIIMKGIISIIGGIIVTVVGYYVYVSKKDSKNDKNDKIQRDYDKEIYQEHQNVIKIWKKFCDKDKILPRLVNKEPIQRRKEALLESAWEYYCWVNAYIDAKCGKKLRKKYKPILNNL